MLNPECYCLRCMSPLSAPNAPCPRCGSRNAKAFNQPHQLAAGSILAGSYFVGCALGQGGFGITYIGLDLALDTRVAIKEYYPAGFVTRMPGTNNAVTPLPGERESFFLHGRDSFVEEARALARFSGEPAIVNVRRFFYENNTAYFVMDYIDGVTLKAYAAAHGGRLPAAETLTLLRPVLGALARIHESGLLHRDVAPDNIMITGNGAVKLLDFGAVRQFSELQNRSMTISVKNGFAPEEQYRTHGAQGPWSDVYAFCATVYALATGSTPPSAVDRLVGGEPLTRPTALGAAFTPEQEEALLHGLAVRTDERTQDMRTLERALYGTQAAEAAPAAPKKKRNAALWIAAAALTAAAVIAVFAVQSARARKTVQSAAALTEAPMAAAAVTAETYVSPTPRVTAAPARSAEGALPFVTAAAAAPSMPAAIPGDYTYEAHNSILTLTSYTGSDTEITLPAEANGMPVRIVGPAAFTGRDMLKRVSIPDGITELGEDAFRVCISLKAVYLPDGLERIGNYAFSGCTSLESIELPDSVREIGAYTFMKCTALKSINIPYGVTNIWYEVFLGCTSLSEVVLPESVKSIGAFAFSNCTSLTGVTIPASVTKIGGEAFSGCNRLTIVCPSGSYAETYAKKNGIPYRAG